MVRHKREEGREGEEDVRNWRRQYKGKGYVSVGTYLVEVGYTFSSYHQQQHGASGIMTYSCRKVESGAERIQWLSGITYLPGTSPLTPRYRE